MDGWMDGWTTTFFITSIRADALRCNSKEVNYHTWLAPEIRGRRRFRQLFVTATFTGEFALESISTELKDGALGVGADVDVDVDVGVAWAMGPNCKPWLSWLRVRAQRALALREDQTRPWYPKGTPYSVANPYRRPCDVSLRCCCRHHC